MINLSCSIVTYNNDPEVLKKTINSFFTAGIPSRQLYIIDNSTRNNIYDHIQQYNGSIKYIRNKKNIGFGKAHNIAIQDIFHHNGGARYHLILNPDVWFNGKTLLNMIDYMDKHHSIGMMSPKVLYPDGSFQYVHRRLPAPRDSLVRMFHKILPQKFVNKINTRYEMQNMNENNIQQIPHLSGCFMLVRGEALQKIGAFDKRFFLYFEDIDFSRRIRQSYQTIYYPKEKIYHIYARQSYNNFRVKIRHIISAIRYFTKWGWFFDRERKKLNNS